jgi:hypothetical protein
MPTSTAPITVAGDRSIPAGVTIGSTV